MVEFALVLPVLALVLFGIIQFGITFKNSLELTDAVRAGARQAAVSRDLPNPEAEAENRVRSAAASLNQPDLTVSVSSSWVQGEDVSVTASYPYEISLIGLVVSSGQLSSTTTERVE